MKIRDLFSMAFKNLWRRKVRTFLTVLGVVIGCVSIIVMVSFGKAQEKQLEEITGSTEAMQTIQVMSTAAFDPTMDKRPPQKGMIDDRTIEKIEGMANVDKVIYSKELDPYYLGHSLELGNYIYTGSILGMDPDMVEDAGYTLKEGRMFNEDSNTIEVLVSDMAGYMMTEKGQQDSGGGFTMAANEDMDFLNEKGKLTLGGGVMGPMGNMGLDGETPTMTGKKNFKVQVVGTIESSSFMSMDGLIMARSQLDDLNETLANMADISTSNKATYQRIQVKVKDKGLINETTDAIKDMGLEAYNDTEFVEQMNSATSVMQAVLAGIGGISLLVAAIGITNTMVMSIYERTKEIGVMKVIGAKVSDIRNLFLLEAGLIGLTGGLIGLALSYLISFSLNNLAASSLGLEAGQQVSIITPGLALGALLVSFLIGLVTGYYPAVRATRLSAIEAIKTE